MTKLFCGIDMTKFELIANIYNPSTGEIILDSLHFTNDDNGFKMLSANLKKNKNREIIIDFELTGPIIRPYSII